MMNIVLLEPEMPSNTGNIGRTCVATNTRLHLIEPLGFKLNEKALKRAGLDYWDKLDVSVYSDYQDFLEKNPQVRMVINCITLETVGETLSCIKEMQTERSEWKWESEVVQLGVSRSKEIGRYHMMMGENPIYIITIQAHKKENFV